MKNQLNLLNQLQELVLTRDEHHQTGDGSHMDSLDNAIDDLSSRIENPVRGLYQRLYKRDHIVMAPMVEGSCAICRMKLPISQVQQVKLAKTIQTCPSCGRILFDEEGDAPRYIGERLSRAEESRKVGISRFSAESLMVPGIPATNAESAIRILATAMEKNKFISNSEALVAAALEREGMRPTPMGSGLAFPHVRGVEGGGLTLALGVSQKGFDYGGEKVHLVFFTTIPTAVSVFYLRLMSTLVQTFGKQENVDALLAASTPEELWKAFMKTTRKAVK